MEVLFFLVRKWKFRKYLWRFIEWLHGYGIVIEMASSCQIQRKCDMMRASERARGKASSCPVSTHSSCADAISWIKSLCVGLSAMVFVSWIFFGVFCKIKSKVLVAQAQTHTHTQYVLDCFILIILRSPIVSPAKIVGNDLFRTFGILSFVCLLVRSLLYRIEESVQSTIEDGKWATRRRNLLFALYSQWALFRAVICLPK